MKTKNIIRNQKGMVPIWELLLLVALVGILGFVGYRAYQARQAKPAIPTDTQAGDPYAGWKTHESSFQNVSFRYPADWAIKSEDAAAGTELGKPKTIYLVSPSGFTLAYYDFVDGLGGGCDEGTPHLIIKSVEELKDAGGSRKIYLVRNAHNMVLSGSDDDGTPKVGDYGTCGWQPTIDGRAVNEATYGRKYSTIVFGQSDPHLSFPQLSHADQPVPSAQKADAEIGAKILKSFKFE